MSRCANTNLLRPLIAGAAAAALACGASSALANSGGAAPGAPGTTPSGSSSAQPGDTTATASGGGVTLTARISAFLHHQLRFSGTVSRSSAGRTAVIERLDRSSGWVPAASGRVASDGSFTAIWQTNHIGRFQTRVVLQSSSGAVSHAAADTPTLQVTVYRPSIATIFGQGFWGQRTACGQILRHKTLGVANRTLPCGTKVAIYYRGRTIVVPVIDRGPYANHADWDLTEATAQALSMSDTETIGAVSLPR